MGKGRASVFDDTEDAIDLSTFVPTPDVPQAPTQEQVRAVSEAANFPSRERPKAAPKPKREPRRYRTGRNVQFNAKASQATVDRFYALCDATGWVMGYTLERAVEALENELKKQK